MQPATDSFGTPISIGDTVVQDRRDSRSALKEIIDISEDGLTVKLVDTSYNGRSSTVRTSMIAKYFVQKGN